MNILDRLLNGEMPKEVVADGSNGTEVTIKMVDGKQYRTNSKRCEITCDSHRDGYGDSYRTYKVSFYVESGWEEVV